jgi:hypothetical protein
MPTRISRAAYADMFGPAAGHKREILGFRQEAMGKL